MGFLIFVGLTLVSWLSRKHNTMACSSTKAEYTTITTTLEELDSIKYLLTKLGIQASMPLKILSGIQGATFIAHNPICHTKLKHVMMDLHFVIKRTKDRTLIVQHIAQNQQLANVVTKALRPKPFHNLKSKLVEDLPQV